MSVLEVRRIVPLRSRNRGGPGESNPIRAARVEAGLCRETGCPNAARAEGTDCEYHALRAREMMRVLHGYYDRHPDEEPTLDDARARLAQRRLLAPVVTARPYQHPRDDFEEPGAPAGRGRRASKADGEHARLVAELKRLGRLQPGDEVKTGEESRDELAGRCLRMKWKREAGLLVGRMFIGPRYRRDQDFLDRLAAETGIQIVRVDV